MIKVISFDLDGTIMQPGFGDSVWLEGLPLALANQKGISDDIAKNKMIKAYDETGSDKREWYDLTYWIKELKLTLNPNKLLNSYKHMVKPYPDAYKVIKRLSKQFDLIISSGAMREFITIELSISNLSDYFKDIFSSTTDTKTVKKDPDFYKMICKKLNVEPDEIVHIGDNLEYDYISPKKAGMMAFYLNRDATSNDAFTVKSLKEFEFALNKL
jgi:putative hydrolase of the HAD superfamily